MALATATSSPNRPSRAQVETGVLSGLIVAGAVAGVAFLANRRGQAPGLAVETASLPPSASGFPYSASLAASGGVPPYSWALTQGALPPGLQLSPSGTIVGIPTGLGAYTFSVTVSDSSHTPLSAEESLTLLVAQGEVVSTTVLPPGQVGQAYSATLTAQGGTPPYSWQVNGGALPGGLTLSAAGEVSGTPSVAGSFGFAAQAQDSGTPPEVRQGTVAIVVVAAPAPAPVVEPPVPAGTPATPAATVVPATPPVPVVTVSPAGRVVTSPAAVITTAAQVPPTTTYLQANPGIRNYPPQVRPVSPQLGQPAKPKAKPAAAPRPAYPPPQVRPAGRGGGGSLQVISDGGNRWGLLDSGGTLHPIRNPRLALLQGYPLLQATRYSPRAFGALPVGRSLV
ncbi:MAG: Ig domain-containing protein [Candidatus Dormibacteria bacterium]